VLRQGPIPALIHGIIEYVAGVVFIVAPFVLGFQSGAATAISIIVGVIVLVVAASSEGPSGLISQIPISAHVALDFVLAAALIIMPFAFGFSEEGAPTAFFITLGVVHLLLTIATRFRPKAPEGSAGAAPPSSPRG
jgi:VIT1/CCC1 family predicted Fe2+/Mn2+ transporter